MRKILKIFLASAALSLLFAASSYAQNYYVDAKNGKDYNNGANDAPFKTIQKAADIVRAGDTVIIRSGIYYENVKITASGTKDSPIIFRAEEYGKGKTVITGADKRIRENPGKDVWELYDKDKNIYRTKLNRNNMLMRFLYNGQDIYMYPTYEGLETNVTIPIENANYLLGLKHGYYMDCENGYLYVRLRDDERYGSVNPNENEMLVSSQRYLTYTDADGTEHEALQASAIQDDSYNIGIITDEPANIVLYGLTFEAPGFASVYIRSSDVKVSNCWFVGAACGVKGGSRYTSDKYVTKNVTVEYCDWTQSPVFEDAMELVAENYDNPLARARSTYWFLRKVTAGTPSYLSSTYSYESGGFTGSMGENWVLRNNYIHDCFDGISWYSNWLYTDSYPDGTFGREVSGKNHKMYENRFENCIDNAIELEFNANGFDIHHNEFVNSPDSVSVQMGRGQPFSTNIYFHHNLIYNEYDWAADWYKYASKPEVPWANMANFFKLGVPTSQYKSPLPHMKNEPWNYEKNMPLNTVRWGDSGMKIYNNTMYGPYSYMFNNLGYFALELSQPGEDHNVELKNNIISSMRKYEEKGTTRQWLIVGDSAESRGGYSYGKNMFIPYSDDKKPENSFMFIESNASDPLFGNGGKLINNIKEAGMKNPEKYEFELTENSPARGMGEQIPWESADTTDVGAIPYGEKWHIDYSPFPFGDVNCDNKVDAADLAVLNLIFGAKDGDSDFKCRADLNFDGVIDQKDAALIMNEIAAGEGRQ